MIVGEGEILIKDLYYVLYKAHIGSIKECNALIKKGYVKVNNQVCFDKRYLVSSSDSIEVKGQQIIWPFVYIMMNKPKGYLSASKDNNNHYVTELIEDSDCFCVGRLDKDTTGLLLLSNDPLLKKLLLPDNHVNKVYKVIVDKDLNDKLIPLFKEGIIIDKNIKCHSSHLEILDQRKCLVTLDEGKYHQVKKMFLSCGYKVLELKRISFAGILLDDSLKEGEYRYLNNEEFLILEKSINSCL